MVYLANVGQGYETRIGERGASLSGGQKQRIVIARSIISNPRVLLLDEATSALDPSAEKIVQQALNNVAKGRTMIVIAHRLSTIREADNIIVMSKGQTIEQGSHSQLVELNGAYARLVKAQDLGHQSISANGEIDDKDVAEEDLDIAPTNASVAHNSSTAVEKETEYGLLYGLYLIFKEQRSMWVQLAIVLVCCVAAGMSLEIPSTLADLLIRSTRQEQRILPWQFCSLVLWRLSKLQMLRGEIFLPSCSSWWQLVTSSRLLYSAGLPTSWLKYVLVICLVNHD